MFISNRRFTHMAATNLFTTAKVIEAKGTAGKKSAKSLTLIEGLEVYAAIDHSIKWLKTVLETSKGIVAETAIQKFIADGIKALAKPANFDGEEGDATGNIQLKKRMSTSGLNDIEKELAAEYKIPTVELSDRPETYIFNPAHAEWLQKNAAKVSAALIKLGAPEDVIQFQNATTRVITTDDSIDFVFRTYAKKPDVIAQLLPVVSTFAIKPKFDDGDDAANDKALNVIKSFIGGE
jgi:hypothetical protein